MRTLVLTAVLTAAVFAGPAFAELDEDPTRLVGFTVPCDPPVLTLPMQLNEDVRPLDLANEPGCRFVRDDDASYLVRNSEAEVPAALMVPYAMAPGTPVPPRRAPMQAGAFGRG